MEEGKVIDSNPADFCQVGNAGLSDEDVRMDGSVRTARNATINAVFLQTNESEALGARIAHSNALYFVPFLQVASSCK
eukprot:scaffold551337_cov36-Prasinocladus_malaysianus.AAC.1